MVDVGGEGGREGNKRVGIGVLGYIVISVIVDGQVEFDGLMAPDEGIMK